MSILLIVLVVGCASISNQAQYKLPAANAKFDYQLGGAYTPPKGVTVVARDRLDSPARLGYDICYMSGFQTQSADGKKFFKEHPDLIVQVNGKPLEDPDWPGDYMYDTSTEAKRVKLANIVTPWIKECKSKGYSAVDIDNLDSFYRSKKKLTAANNIDLAKKYATIAHAQGLAIAQKNTGLFSKQIQAAGYDFAVTESCYNKNKDCLLYTNTYTVVLDIEYTDALGKNAFSAACNHTDRPKAMIMRDRNLKTPKDKNYYYQACK